MAYTLACGIIIAGGITGIYCVLDQPDARPRDNLIQAESSTYDQYYYVFESNYESNPFC